MAENSAIEWTHHTFNPWWGCQKVSPACDHCYAERDAKRFAAGQVLWGVDSERRTFGDKHWKAPTDWNTKARESREQLGNLHERPRVFCASMGDWLDLDAPLDQFVKLLDLVRTTPELDWLLLSKRIGNWRKRVTEAQSWCLHQGLIELHRWLGEWLDGTPPANVWLGATIVNQEEFDRDIAKLDAAPARVRFLSIEPMLGPITLHWEWLWGTGSHNGLDWIICGGESGPGARPMHPDWARSLRDQCNAAGVPFLFKQWGEWRPVDGPRVGAAFGQSPVPEGAARVWLLPDGTVKPRDENSNRQHSPYGTYIMAKAGKKAAGRLLDRVQHDGYPA